MTDPLDTRTPWEEKADFWDDLMGQEGNAWQRDLIAPPVEEMLAVQPGEAVLDVACGNGFFARRLAGAGAAVTGVDFSQALLAHARRRSSGEEGAPQSIDYRHVDATDKTQLLALGAGRFDAAVCLMAMMDMWTIDPMLEALAVLLKPGGRFVFCVPHPAFNMAGGRAWVVERTEEEGVHKVRHALKIWQYLTPRSTMAIGAVGEPTGHYDFHRPLHLLLERCFAAGFVMDGLAEPAWPANAESTSLYGWANLPDLPPILVARLRLVGTVAT